jgi:hypothetical protein
VILDDVVHETGSVIGPVGDNRDKV